MIAKITRGQRMSGLVHYLTGDTNEHHSQQVIASSPDVMVDYDRPLEKGEVHELWTQLDAANAAHPDATVAGGQGHVWHLSLSLPPGEELTNDQWAHAVETVLERCGMKDVSWAAIRHGESQGKGGHHVHVAATVLKGDGRECWHKGDFTKAGQACSEIEREFGLFEIDGRNGAGHDRDGLTKPELELAERHGDLEPDRVTLARQVRAAARSSETEAEFVRRLRSNGVEAIPRYQTGSDQNVAGCSFRRQAVTAGGEERAQFGGGRLAKDLTLPKMREWAGWTDVSKPEGELPGDFYKAWPTGPAWRGEPDPTIDGGELRETLTIDGEAWNTAQENTAAMPPVDNPADTAQLAATAREAAAATAALAGQVEGWEPGELSRLSDLLARSAQAETRAVDIAQRRNAMLGVATIAAQAALTFTRKPSKGKEVVAWALVAAQLVRLSGEIAKLHAARGEHHRAQQLVNAGQAVVDRYRDEGVPAAIEELDRDMTTERVPEPAAAQAHSQQQDQAAQAEARRQAELRAAMERQAAQRDHGRGR